MNIQETICADIYRDNSASLGLRTRYFRNAVNGGVEWIYGVDYASGCNRWYYFHPSAGRSIDSLIGNGMQLSRIDCNAA